MAVLDEEGIRAGLQGVPSAEKRELVNALCASWRLLEVVREVISTFAPQAESAGCEVVLSEHGPVVGQWDRLRLEQVVTNLLTNAFKYGAGKPVRCACWAGRTQAQLSVADKGIGIEPEHLSRIFGRFERAVSDKHYGGLGLGLYITRQIVEALNGEVHVTSHPGQGSTFTVHAPLHTGARAAALPRRGFHLGGSAQAH